MMGMALKPLVYMVRPAGLEPATLGLEGRQGFQLNQRLIPLFTLSIMQKTGL